MSELDLSAAREALTAAGITGPHRSHERGGTVSKIHALLDGDREATFGISGIEKYSASEILGFMAGLTGCSSDIADVDCKDSIDPDSTIEGILAAARRLAEAAGRGDSLLVATGHPTGMLDHNIRIADAYVKAGGKVMRPREEESGDAFEEGEPPSAEEVADTAREFVSGLIETMGLEAEIEASAEEDTAFVEVSGESLGVLIGRRGQTLDALQEIARTAVQRRLKARVRLLVDVEGYRARRRASLAEYAHAIAERAKARGTEIELEPMTAYERKIVHDAVAEVDGASSFSEGEEPNRKVVVRGE